MLKFNNLLVIFLISVILAGCGKASTNEEVISDEVVGKDIKELVKDYSLGNLKDESASITSEHLIVKKEDGTESVYELPEDEFFVSVAPYINETHP